MGLQLSWESAALARRRSAVQSRSAPYLSFISASFSFCSLMENQNKNHFCSYCSNIEDPKEFKKRNQEGIPDGFCGFCVLCKNPGHLLPQIAAPSSDIFCETCHEKNGRKNKIRQIFILLIILLLFCIAVMFLQRKIRHGFKRKYYF